MLSLASKRLIGLTSRRSRHNPFIGIGLVGAPACGDVMKLQIKIDDKTKKNSAKTKIPNSKHPKSNQQRKSKNSKLACIKRKTKKEENQKRRNPHPF
ncbi:hypothetical protein ES319_A04G037500v1 [Gossypium barbadense]|uniref:NIF system FeS cluster assembly NifU N-terminal domain-containing protein n=1 Tax=Gossypium barbadense TaxID=3634 RepID=A0A5J5W4L7_GOSBA|nr:hypothetical protein ES319_A04G037500v1 [Gossypium barbadense]